MLRTSANPSDVLNNTVDIVGDVHYQTQPSVTQRYGSVEDIGGTARSLAGLSSMRQS